MSSDKKKEGKEARSSRGRLVVPVIISLLLLGIAAGVWGIDNYRQGTSQDSQTTSQKEATPLSAELHIIDGSVEISEDDTNWNVATDGQALTAGTRLRTADDRAEITFSDGSRLRLDQDTQIEINQLNNQALSVKVSKGKIYNLVSEDTQQTWKITGLDTEITALGTIFTVAVDPEEKIINTTALEHQVFVEVKQPKTTQKLTLDPGQNLTVDLSLNPEESLKETALTAEELSTDKFLQWNLDRDPRLKSAIDNLDDKAPSTAAEDLQPVTETETLQLSATSDEKGIHFNWMLKGATAPNGFKLAKASHSEPRYPQDGNKHVPSPQAQSYTWEISDGNTYYFRLCTWDGRGGCELSSNIVKVTTHQSDKNSEPPFIYTQSSLQLSASDAGNGVDLSWSASDSLTFKGYKVIRSEGENDPYYPENMSLSYLANREDTSFTDRTAQSGKTYYYRICALESDMPTTCGNVVKHTLE